MTTINIELGTRSYPVHVGVGLVSSLDTYLKRTGISGHVGLVSSKKIHQLYGAKVEEAFGITGCKVSVVLIPDGEEVKNLSTVSNLYDSFLQAGLDRASTLVSLGGGVIGDLTGFVAATLFRGIPYIQIPTTLLAMVDASIGGKTGVNHPRGKNLIGAFHQPQAVFIDPTLVHTLPQRELTAALTEILKVAAISDSAFYEQLSQNIQSLASLSNMQLLEDAVIRACRTKAQIVIEDEREGNRRRVLNFGHTLGHALEATLGYGTLRHGEAVGLGMVAAGHISTRATNLSQSELEVLIAPITQLNLPTLPALDVASLQTSLQHDKKTRDGVIHFVLLEAIGRPIITTQVTERQIEDALNELQRRFG
ncbi:MAG: 3-dehydroquinate synthase [Fidelibacterota bacterium]|nr:MAG: 3-dehydroquinate synthase [Candidatus Neomarinimicrobiota bacterium]